jgi:DNA polymerase III gamma/tau subunit
MLFIFLFSLIQADLQSDLTKASYLNDILTSLLRSTQENHLFQILEQLKILEQEIKRAEKLVSVFEQTIINLAEGHAKFNETEASKVQKLVNSMEELIGQLDQKVRSVDFSTVKNTIPKAIAGQATVDFQAFHSVDKIKQESIKLESTIAENLMFVFIWVLNLTMMTLLVYNIYLTNKLPCQAFSYK